MAKSRGAGQIVDKMLIQHEAVRSGMTKGATLALVRTAKRPGWTDGMSGLKRSGGNLSTTTARLPIPAADWPTWHDRFSMHQTSNKDKFKCMWNRARNSR